MVESKGESEEDLIFVRAVPQARCAGILPTGPTALMAAKLKLRGCMAGLSTGVPFGLVPAVRLPLPIAPQGLLLGKVVALGDLKGTM